MRNRVISAVVAVLMLVVFGACSQKSGPKGYSETLSGALRVYVYADSFFGAPDYDAPVSSFRAAQTGLDVQFQTFDDAAALDMQLQADLEAGTPPDLLLCSRYGMTDVSRLFADGSLADLSAYLSADSTFDPEMYYAAALDACTRKEKVFALPLSLSPVMLVTSEEKLAQSGLDWDAAVTAAEKLTLLSGYITRTLEEDPAAAPYMAFPSDADFASSFLHPLGLTLWDSASETVVEPDADALRLAIDWFLAAQKSSENGWNLGFVQKVRGIPEKWDALCQNVTFANPSVLAGAEDYRTLDAYCTLRGETLRLLCVPTLSDPEKYAATVSTCGVIPVAASNPDAGYALLRYLMDWEGDTGFGLPVRRESVENALGDAERPYVGQLLSVLDRLGQAYLFEPVDMESDLYAYVCDSGYAKNGEDLTSLRDALVRRAETWLAGDNS